MIMRIGPQSRQLALALAGSTAAACLLRAGFDVHVYEQASRLSEVGAGINIGPSASRVLHRLGIAEVLRETGVEPQSFDQRRWNNGHILLRSPLGAEVEGAFGAPYYTLHRGDLHRALVDVIPPDRLHLAHRFTQLLDYGDFVEACFENGASVSADALIGADGIHSAVRHALFGPEKPRFTGCVAHRGIMVTICIPVRSHRERQFFRVDRVASVRPHLPTRMSGRQWIDGHCRMPGISAERFLPSIRNVIGTFFTPRFLPISGANAAIGPPAALVKIAPRASVCLSSARSSI